MLHFEMYTGTARGPLTVRSNPPFQVAPVAQAFGGGGHLQASGATFPGGLADCLREVVPRLRRQLG